MVAKGKVRQISPCFHSAILDFVEFRLHKIFCHAGLIAFIALSAFLLQADMGFRTFPSIGPVRLFPRVGHGVSQVQAGPQAT